MVLPLAYGAFVVLAVALVRTRGYPTALRGIAVFGFHALALTVSASSWLVWEDAVPLVFVYMLVGLSVISVLLWNVWLVSPFDRPTVHDLIRTSLEQLLADYEWDEGVYLVSLKEGPARLRLRALPGGWGMLRFVARGSPPKWRLFKNLLRKRFSPVFPRLRIRLA